MKFNRALISILLLCVALFSIADAETDQCLEYGQSGNSEKAIEECTRSIGSGKHSGSELAGFFRIRGTAYYKKAQYDMAISDFTRAIELDPESTHVSFEYYWRGRAHGNKGDYEKAILDFTAIVNVDPRQLWLARHFWRGWPQ
jgi:tetratricopeptide (TPR) repeat protein